MRERRRSVQPPWVDGEKIPDEDVRRIFRQPPGAPPAFYRSSLVIGSRGVGKTTLLRYHKETHNGIAVHINLATVFGSLTKQTALGPLGFDHPPDLERALAGKAGSLLALEFAERVLRKGVSVGEAELGLCLPAELRPQTNGVTKEWIDRARKDVARTGLEVFADIGEGRPLTEFVAALGDTSVHGPGPLLLLLDRADMVASAALEPIFELLDQSAQYVVLLAMRPGHVSQTVATLGETVVPGDHYGIVHLGTEPLSQEWNAFATEAVEAQIGELSEVPSATAQAIIRISRDSLRTALELFARYLWSGRHEELLEALGDLHENQMTAAQKILQKYQPDFRGLVNDLRSEAIKLSGGIAGPLILKVKKQDVFFDVLRPIDRFDIEEALRLHPQLAQFKVEDGVVPAGARWADHIRERIIRAKVVVGDVTGMRVDVMFELGLAYGLNKIVVPVTTSRAQVSSFPRWLGATQLGNYGDKGGLVGIVSSIATHLADPEFARVRRAPQPIPGLAVWLRGLSWNQHALDQFLATARREALTPEVISDDTPGEVVLRRALRANLLVVSLDNTEADSLMHFVCGAVVAKPSAGYGTLARVILILEEPGQERQVTADSLQRCHEVVRLGAFSEIVGRTEGFARAFKAWVRRSMTGGGRR